jgi:hypothetical protein
MRDSAQRHACLWLLWGHLEATVLGISLRWSGDPDPNHDHRRGKALHDILRIRRVPKATHKATHKGQDPVLFQFEARERGINCAPADARDTDYKGVKEGAHSYSGDGLCGY